MGKMVERRYFSNGCTLVPKLYKNGMLSAEDKEKYEKLLDINQPPYPKGKIIDWWVTSTIRFACPKCQAEQEVNYGETEDLPDSEELKCMVCGTRFEVEIPEDGIDFD